MSNVVQVYGSVVANRYSNQHILPLSQMSVSAECFYQPRVNADFDEDSEQMELGKRLAQYYLFSYLYT